MKPQSLNMLTGGYYCGEERRNRGEDKDSRGKKMRGDREGEEEEERRRRAELDLIECVYRCNSRFSTAGLL